jgi:hypothetical protein
MKQAYIKDYDDYYYSWVKIEPTGLCKKIVGGPYKDKIMVQIQRRYFGIPFGKYWIDKESIHYFDPIIETYYSCNCLENNEKI